MKKVGTSLLVLALPVLVSALNLSIPGLAVILGFLFITGQNNIGLIAAIAFLVFFFTGDPFLTL